MSHDDFDFEAVRGLPAELPEGEELVWQGSPDWKSLAVHAYHVRKVAAYFLALELWRIAVGVSAGHTAPAILMSCLTLAGLGAIAVSVLSLLAYFNARSTIYSITTRRVLIRSGVAVPLTVNVPFTLIDSAALKTFANGTGDIALTLQRRQRVGYVITWPHVRPGRFARPCPSLRALTDAAAAADILARALAADSGAPLSTRIETRPGRAAVPPRTAASHAAAIA